MTSLYALDAVNLLECYRNGRASPIDVLAQINGRIDNFQPSVNAFSLMNQHAFDDAKASEQRWSAKQPIGPLDGVPIIVKDNMAVKEMPASWGNAELAKRVVLKDELPVERLRAAGAVIVGKANTPEFAVEGYTANATFGVTTNPFDINLTPGGSSGAVSAAVASGQSTIGIGTDGGGSIRRPAAYCGLIGLKPGLGRYPRAHGLPQVLLDFEVVGPLTRSVRDSRLVDQVLSGPSRLDPISRRVCRKVEKSDAPKVLYVPQIYDEPYDPMVLLGPDRFVNWLDSNGFEVSEGALPIDLISMTDNWKTIAELGMSQLFEHDESLYASASDRYKEMAERGRSVTARQLWQILDTVKQLRIQASLLFSDWDIVINPVTAAMPWDAASSFPPEINGQTVGPRGHAVYSGWVNAIGHPSIAMPAITSKEGMPIGVQLVADIGGESLLLDVAEQFEVETGGFIWPSEYK